MDSMPKRSDDLSREGEQSQETEKGLRIPVPKKSEFFENLRKTAKGALSRRSGRSEEKR